MRPAGFCQQREFAFAQAARYNDCQTAVFGRWPDSQRKKGEQLMRRQTLLLACGIILSGPTIPLFSPEAATSRCDSSTGNVHHAGRPSQHDGATWNRQLRPGPSGNPSAPNSANHDEAVANPYRELPEILKLKNGSLVTTPEQWWNKRRPEIVEDFDREVLARSGRCTESDLDSH